MPEEKTCPLLRAGANAAPNDVDFTHEGVACDPQCKMRKLCDMIDSDTGTLEAIGSHMEYWITRFGEIIEQGIGTALFNERNR